jgi:uncharacterized membrane protein
VLKLYEEKLDGIHSKIRNQSRSLALREQDFEYLLQTAENEVIKTPQNQILKKLDGAENFMHAY